MITSLKHSYFSHLPTVVGTVTLTNIRRKQKERTQYWHRGEVLLIRCVKQLAFEADRKPGRPISYVLLHVVLLGKVVESIWCQATAVNVILIMTSCQLYTFPWVKTGPKLSLVKTLPSSWSTTVSKNCDWSPSLLFWTKQGKLLKILNIDFPRYFNFL